MKYVFLPDYSRLYDDVFLGGTSIILGLMAFVSLCIEVDPSLVFCLVGDILPYRSTI